MASQSTGNFIQPEKNYLLFLELFVSENFDSVWIGFLSFIFFVLESM